MPLTQAELLLASERRLKYQGTAKVDVDQICFQRRPDPAKAERLRRILLKERCLRLDVRNHVVCVVSRQNLEASLQAARSTAAALMTNDAESYPFLQFPDQALIGLHGLHRIEVSREILPPFDRWWTVDIYLDGCSPRPHYILQD